MKRSLQAEWAAGTWRRPLVAGLLALVVLAGIGYFVVRALGGTQELGALMQQVQALGMGMRDWIEQSGPWAPLTYLAAKAITFIFLPWAGYPLNVASGALFGLFWGVVLTALGDTLGGCILYGLSRWAGRPAVARVLGEGRMARVDRIVDTGLGGWRELLFFRITCPAVYNLVSFAAGSTRLSFREYLAVTTFGGIVHTGILVTLGASVALGWEARVAAYAGIALVAVLAFFGGRRLRDVLARGV
jgi:uncharacterized membrane protein YdjX (TVP38/TMEM64 family)